MQTEGQASEFYKYMVINVQNQNLDSHGQCLVMIWVGWGQYYTYSYVKSGFQVSENSDYVKKLVSGNDS